MINIFTILFLFLGACSNIHDSITTWDKTVNGIAKQEYQNCLKNAQLEFKDTISFAHKKTCKCVVDYLYSNETYDLENNDIPDRFAMDLRTLLMNKCGKDIPAYIMRDIP